MWESIPDGRLNSEPFVAFAAIAQQEHSQIIFYCTFQTWVPTLAWSGGQRHSATSLSIFGCLLTIPIHQCPTSNCVNWVIFFLSGKKELGFLLQLQSGWRVVHLYLMLLVFTLLCVLCSPRTSLRVLAGCPQHGWLAGIALEMCAEGLLAKPGRMVVFLF